MRDVDRRRVAFIATTARQQAIGGQVFEGLFELAVCVIRCAQRGDRLLTARVRAALAELNQAQEDAPADEDGGDDDVVDAEFEEVDEEVDEEKKED